MPYDDPLKIIINYFEEPKKVKETQKSKET
jgi:hypothetical protein